MSEKVFCEECEPDLCLCGEDATYRVGFAAGVRAMRSVCAAKADEVAQAWMVRHSVAPIAAMEIAKAIRALPDPEPQ